jgi:sec-independent protein translocase protein TatA
MFGIGGQEIVMLLVLGMLLFGATHLPRLGRSAGKTVTEFKRGLQGIEDDIEGAGNPRTSRVESESVRPPRRINHSGPGAVSV